MSEKIPPGVRQIGENHWEIRVRVRNRQTGARAQAKRRVHGELSVAIEEQDRLREELRDGQGGKTQRLTLGAYAKTWAARKRARGAKASGLASQSAILAGHVLPKWGDWYIDAIRRKDVEDWLAWCATRTSPRTKKRYSPRTINSWLVLLQTLVGSACREMELGPSPLARIEPLRVPRRARKDPNLLSAEQLSAFLDAVRSVNEDRHAMAFIGFTTGLRWCELSALRWEDLDEATGILHVVRAQWKGRIGEPKTESSYRSIPLVPEQLQMLREHRRRMVAGQHPGLASGYMFPSRRSCVFLCTNGMNKVFAEARKRAEIPFRLTTHAMRRTFNNLVRQQGVGSVVLHSLTGHSSDKMTELYSVVGSSEQAQAVGKVVSVAQGLAQDG